MIPRLMLQLARFHRAESGATAIEYAMIASGIGAFLAATIFGLGSNVRTGFFEKIANLM
jgi:Flp pilus assembly pilin Flp